MRTRICAAHNRRIEAYFPIEFVNEFKKAFRSAKWDASYKRWTVAESAKKRLESWIETVAAQAAELEAIEAQELTARETEELEQQIARVIEQRRRAVEEIETVRRDRATVEKFKDRLDRETEKLEAAKKELRDVRDDVSRVQLHAALDPASDPELAARALALIDLNEVEKLRRVMSKNIGVPKAYAREAFKDAQSELSALRKKLRAGGVDSPQIYESCCANSSRRDRDRRSLTDALIFEVREVEED